MADGQFAAAVVDGSAQAISVNIPANVSYQRAKVIRIDWGVHSASERAYWVLWQGDIDISGTLVNTADGARTQDYAMFPLASGLEFTGGIAEGKMQHFSLSPHGLYINDEQKLVLCADPTLGVGFLGFYISVLFMGTG